MSALRHAVVRWSVSALAVVSLCALAADASADPAPTPSWLAPPPAAPAVAQAPARSGWRSAAAVAFVVALGGFAVYQRSRRGGSTRKATTPKLRVLETTRLGQGGQLVLAEVGGRVMLLGVTAHNIRRIAVLPKEEQVAAASAPSDVADEEERAPESRPRVLSARELVGDLEAPTFSSALKSLLHAVPGASPRKAELPEPPSAALAIAEQTSDVRETVARERPTVRERPAPRERPTVIEGQAAGLRRRRA